MLDIEADAQSAGVDAEQRAAGEPAVGPYRCAACGYGVAVYRVLPACPMCAGDLWVPDAAAGRVAPEV